MIVRIAAGSVPVLDQADVFTALKVEAAGEPPREAEQPYGLWSDDRQHVWLDPAWLRSSGPDEAGWQDKLDAMLAYARDKGWIDASGRVRAHVETA